MANNRGVVYVGPGKVEVQSIDFPKLALGSRKCEHGVILKLVITNICGSDQHMVRGRTTAPAATSPKEPRITERLVGLVMVVSFLFSASDHCRWHDDFYVTGRVCHRRPPPQNR